ncbi:Outer membrane efflux protein [Planctomycetes bacterium K23_9]|uniref:Outer membrane efflux protein n=2 Tax=Stieleria marina TaxID=1930275 RepID=A0A517NY27_9BACT|nr:Outer membrane efflux protein [Planctomycetes bacterium K23_9]
MAFGDVNQQRRICLDSRSQKAAKAVFRRIAFVSALLAAQTAAGQQPPPANAATPPAPAIKVSAEPVIPTRANPFANGLKSAASKSAAPASTSATANPFIDSAVPSAKPSRPIATSPNLGRSALTRSQTATANPFAKSKPAIEPLQGPVQKAVQTPIQWPPTQLASETTASKPTASNLPKAAGANLPRLAAPMSQPSNSVPALSLPSADVLDAAITKHGGPDKKPAFAFPEKRLQVNTVATRTRVVDSMSLGDESSGEPTEIALPQLKPPAEQTDGYTLAMPAAAAPVSPSLNAASKLPKKAQESLSPSTKTQADGPESSSLPSYARQNVNTLSAPTVAENSAFSDVQMSASELTPESPSASASHDASHPQHLVSPPSRPIPHSVSHGSMGRFLDPYRVRASETADDESIEIIDPQQMFAESGPQGTMPAAEGFDMWWESEMTRPIGFTRQSLSVDVGTLTQTALVSSPYVRGLLTKPHIRRSDIVIADAEFDPTVFLEGRFTDTNDPVGSDLTTGDNSDRFRDETFTANGGLRKKTRQGADLELAQRGGFQSNNSTFLNPNPQGTTRLEFNFTQPLMRDRGCAVNNIRVLLAQLDLQINNAEVRGDLEDHLIDVTRAYWDLYQSRAQWLQRKRLLDGAQHLNQILQARDAVDSHQRQILRARAALTTRKSDLVRITTRIRDAQSRLRLLTGSQQLIDSQQLELTPQDKPLEFPVAVSTRQSVIAALDNRPDIAQAIRRIQAVSARVGVARNQVLPRLDLILGTYVAGLDDNRNTFGAWANQFGDGRPTYWAGLAYELPVGNRASKARLNRNRWEMSQVMHEFQQATEVAFTEVEIAVRETQTAYNLMVAKKQSIDAAANEVNYLQQRWELLPDPNESAVLLIEDLLEAQERLADEEQAFVAAQVAYAMSWIQLRKATGVLLRFDATDDTPAIQTSQQDSIVPADAMPLSVDPIDRLEMLEPVEEEIPHLSQANRQPAAQPQDAQTQDAQIQASQQPSTPQSPQGYSTTREFSISGSMR